MNLKIDDLSWDELPPAVKAHLIDMDLKQKAREAAIPPTPPRRAQTVRRHPFGPKPLTRADGSVVQPHPQIPEWDQAYEAHCREQRRKMMTTKGAR